MNRAVEFAALDPLRINLGKGLCPETQPPRVAPLSLDKVQGTGRVGDAGLK